jgi:hypothetical protein
VPNTRAIQIGLKGHLPELYVNSILLSVEDVLTALSGKIEKTHEQMSMASSKNLPTNPMEELSDQPPVERPYGKSTKVSSLSLLSACRLPKCLAVAIVLLFSEQEHAPCILELMQNWGRSVNVTLQASRLYGIIMSLRQNDVPSHTWV